MRNTEIEKVDINKILGLVFDLKLTWIPHMQYLKDICVKQNEHKNFGKQKLES